MSFSAMVNRKNLSVALASIVGLLVFQNCSPEGALEKNYSSTSGNFTPDTTSNLTSDSLAQLEGSNVEQAAQLGFDCQVFEDYARCSLKKFDRTPGAQFRLPESIRFSGYDLKLRHLYVGTSNADQQAYSDANCSVPVNYPMGSGVYLKSEQGVIPSCKDDGTGQCVTDLSCRPLAKQINGARYYKNKSLGWTSGEILFDSSSSQVTNPPANAIPVSGQQETTAGLNCTESSGFVRCTKALSSTPGAAYSTPASVKYKGLTLQLRSIYFGTVNADQQAFADSSCTTAVNYPLGSGVYPAALSGSVPSCKSDGTGQCVTDSQCRALKTSYGGARYYKNNKLGWSRSEATYDNSGAAQITGG